MTLTVEVSLSDELAAEAIEAGDEDVPDLALLQQWAAAAYLDEGPAVASMMLATSKEMQQFNKQYRDKDAPTNVLSFPIETPAEIDFTLLGDIILCSEVIKNEAQQQSKSEASHWAHMVVHGMLHLQGYDHIDNDEAEEMEKLEIEILQRLGIANPYN